LSCEGATPGTSWIRVSRTLGKVASLRLALKSVLEQKQFRANADTGYENATQYRTSLCAFGKLQSSPDCTGITRMCQSKSCDVRKGTIAALAIPSRQRARQVVCAVEKTLHSMPLCLVARQLIGFCLVPCSGTIQAFHVELIVIDQRTPIGGAVGN
jgi:hypothetical protein